MSTVPGVAYARLPREARTVVDRLIRQQEEHQITASTLARQRSDIEWTVYRALDNGVPVSVLTTVLDCSSSRIYQIRRDLQARSASAD